MMLRANRKAVTRFIRQQRHFSSTPSTAAADGSKKRAAVGASGSGGGGGGLLFFTLFVTSGIGYLAYKLEEGNPKVSDFLTNNVPQVLPMLDPFRSIIRSWGLLPSHTSLPSSTVPTAAPTTDAAPTAALRRTTAPEQESSPTDPPANGALALAVTSSKVETTAEVKNKGEQIAANSTPASTPASAPTTTYAPAAAPATTTAAATIDQLTAAEVKARQTRLTAASELFDELSLQAVALRKELEQSLLKDLHKLDADALRTRMTQLAAEFFERTKWESLRLHQSLRQVEADVARKYLELMNQQRIELETEMKRALALKEDQTAAHHAHLNSLAQARSEEQLSSALHAQAEDLRRAFTAQFTELAEGVRSELQDELNHNIALLRESHVKELLAVQKKLAALESELSAFSAAADAIDATGKSATRQHQNSSAVLALEGALATSKPFLAELSAVRATATADDDPLTLAIAESIPSTVSAAGVPTLPELRARFTVVRREVRKAALAPAQAPTIIGQLIGSALAAIAPAPKGFVAGSGVEETLSRAAFYLDRGNLAAAVKEVEHVTGYPKVLTTDWSALASSRLLADQAAVALRTSALLRHAAYGNGTVGTNASQ